MAGLVNARLLGSTLSAEEENEAGAFYHLEYTADKIVEQLSKKDVALVAEHSLSFQPLELKYLSESSVAGSVATPFDIKMIASLPTSDKRNSNTVTEDVEGYVKRHFTYCGEVPDLIAKVLRKKSSCLLYCRLCLDNICYFLDAVRHNLMYVIFLAFMTTVVILLSCPVSSCVLLSYTVLHCAVYSNLLCLTLLCSVLFL